MHQGAWLLWATCGGLVAMSTTNPFYLVPVFAAAFLVHAARGRPGPAARPFRAFVVFGAIAILTRTALVFFGPVRTGSVAAAALEGLRLAVMLSVFGAFNSVADPFGLLRLAPRRFHEPALAAALALSLAPRTFSAAGQVREAQRLRGIRVARWRSIPALAVPVLATGMEQAVTLAESMDARGHGRGRRSRYRPERWTRRAWVVAAVAVTAALAFVLFGEYLGGGLAVETYPLAWPEASPWLVAAALGLAAPAWVAEPPLCPGAPRP